LFIEGATAPFFTIEEGLMPGIAFAGGAFPEQIGSGEEPVVEVAAVEAPEAPAEPPAEVVIHEAPHAAMPSRKRARHPKGSDKGGEFVGDDPATPENEAFENGSGSIKG